MPSWTACGVGGGAQAQQEEDTLAKTSPGFPTPLTEGSQLNHILLGSNHAQAFVLLGFIQTFPKTPFSSFLWAVWGRRRRGKGKGVYLGPVVSAHRRGSPGACCNSSPGKHSTAQPAFVFPASAPRQP